MGKHFVLIHGAWHGGWAWDGVILALEHAGHTAEAPTMPGHGEDADRSAVTFDSYVDAVTSTLERQEKPVVLVAHSSAGFVVQSAAPKASDKIERMVFLNAFILPDGKAQFDLVPPEAAEGMTGAAMASPDNSVPVIEDFVRGMLMAGEPVEAQDALMARLTPQPLCLFTEKVDAKPFAGVSASRSVVFCRDDASLPPGAFLGMAQGLGEFDLIEIDGSHEALVTRPTRVAEALIEAAEAEAEVRAAG